MLPLTLHHSLQHASLLCLRTHAICCELLLLLQLLSHLLKSANLSLQRRQLYRSRPMQHGTGRAG
jgi:hypothetical protein